MKELLSKEENCSILTKPNHYQTMSPIFLLSVAGATVLGSYCLYHFLKKYHPHSLQHLNTLGAIVYKIPSLVCWASISLYYYLGNTNSQPNRSKNSKPKLDTQEEEFQAHIKQRKLANEQYQANKEQYQANERRFQARMEQHILYMEESKNMHDNQLAEILQNLLDPQSRTHTEGVEGQTIEASAPSP